MYKKTSSIDNSGFTLIELLIVVAIIAILAVIVFVALDPLRRFQDSRDSVRWQEAAEMMTAIKLDQLDHGGAYVTAIKNMPTSSIYMIAGDGTVTSCNAQNIYCDTGVSGSAACVDLSDLVDRGYLGKVPISPNGNGTWTIEATGFTLQKDDNGALHVRACESENSTEIEVVR
ncbi:MAG: hypothetical protein A2261_01110 [Candidatus Magasanikbacteria bacterium RIFOXYA2_FULL_44_8]|uniref:General secretion pathway GspH domain-containing protein n=1 Tax=Candidatus Magasanikbacteria bacterium RIFOXYA2_FULL_44_8 TaxID=1798696 RepID=A0A1F6NJK7_9BACT|nr:MAG: hypothetical protein A2261_01110 [Candidatus Magasanikbacteria bacterium RIFOXYA2_FULL_44_8]